MADAADARNLHASLRGAELTISRITQQKDELARELNQVKEELRRATEGKFRPAQVLGIERELERREKVNQDLEVFASGKDRSIESLTSQKYLHERQLKDLESSIVSRDNEIVGLREKVRELQSQLDSTLLSRRGEASLRLQVEHYKDDQDRLLRLLKTTSEFKEFSDFAQSASNVHYHSSNIEKPDSNPDSWFPAEALNLADNFLEKYGNVLPERAIRKLVEDLNKLWRAREKKLVQKVRAECVNDVAELRRELAARKKVDEYSADRSISRLKTDLKAANKDLRNTAFYTGKYTRGPKGIQNVESELAMVAELQKHIKLLRKENATLKASKSGKTSERAKHHEGAV
mmetsp:Transcript_29065/g.52010  ORF Transcript_29065/g.52010 Transcript_29065/m.52010 type:complete len:347 (+) Transcript_29065:135-1175(+)